MDDPTKYDHEGTNDAVPYDADEGEATKVEKEPDEPTVDDD